MSHFIKTIQFRTKLQIQVIAIRQTIFILILDINICFYTVSSSVISIILCKHTGSRVAGCLSFVQFDDPVRRRYFIGTLISRCYLLIRFKLIFYCNTIFVCSYTPAGNRYFF